MGIRNWLFGDDDSTEPTYGQTPLSELSKLKASYAVHPRTSGKIVELNKPRTAWKVGQRSKFDFTLIQLVIPERAKVVYPHRKFASGRKLRTNMAYVAEIYEYDVLDEDAVECSWETSGRYYSAGGDTDFQYVEGEVVVPDKFDDDIREVCTNGIHVYRNKEIAIKEVLR